MSSTGPDAIAEVSAAIDAALANNMNDEAKALRDQGAQLHADGRHDEALQALHEAMAMLGIEH